MSNRTAVKKAGRGKDAAIVIPPELQTLPGAWKGAGESTSIEIALIQTDGPNARLAMDEAQLAGLAKSMSESGQLQAIGVEHVGANAYRLVFGHRRLAAAKMLGWTSIDAVLLGAGNAADIRAAENVQRADLNPIERAIAVGDVFDEEYDRALRLAGNNKPDPLDAKAQRSARAEALAKTAARIGKPIAWINDHVFLATLDPVTRKLTIDGKLPVKYARALVQVADVDKRAEFAKRAAIGGGYRNREFPMEERDFKKMLAEQLQSLAGVPWRLDLEFGGRVACVECPNNSANQVDLFSPAEGINGVVQRGGWGSVSKEPQAGVCLSRSCYAAKSSIANRQITNACKLVTATVSAAKAKTPAAKKAAEAEGIKLAKAKAIAVVPGTLDRRIRDHRDRYSTAAANKPHSQQAATSRGKAKTPAEVAKNALSDALRDWANDAKDAVENLKLSHVQRFLLEALDRGLSYKDAQSGKFPTAEQIDAVVNPTGAKAMALLGGLDSKVVYLDFDFTEDKIGELAAALGAKLAPKPVLADFMPKADAAAGDKGAKKSKMAAKGKK